MTNATSVQVSTATGLKAGEVQRLRKLLETLDREQRGYQFKADAYSRQRLTEIAAQRELTVSELESLDTLSGNELVDRFLPNQRGERLASTEDEALDRNDWLTGRGAYGPSQVVVSRSALPGYRIGGDPAPVDPIAAYRAQQGA